MGKLLDTLIIKTPKDNIFIYREAVSGKTIYKAELYGNREERRFGSPKLRRAFEERFSKTYSSLPSLLDELFGFIKGSRLRVSSMIIKATKGTPFVYTLSEPGRKYFSPGYTRKAFDFTYGVLTRNVEQVEVFFSEGKLIFLHVEGDTARFLGPLAEDEFEDKLPSPKIARALDQYVGKSKCKAVDYVAKVRGDYLVITTDKNTFLSSLRTLAYGRLWR